VAGRKLATSGKLSAADRALGEIEAGKARVKVAMAEKSLDTLRILAPHDGLLLLEKKWTGGTAFVGDSVWPGQKIGEIPDLSELEAKVFVLEADAPAEGRAPARIASKSPGEEYRPGAWSMPSPARAAVAVKYFETTLSLEKTDPAFMKPGERVRAEVRLEEAEGVIAIPRGALFEKDGKRVVYRREGGGFQPVEVTVGRNSVSRVVVEKGLRSGDLVALRDPTQKAAPVAGPKSGPGPVESTP
jgi:hypothetical protein